MRREVGGRGRFYIVISTGTSKRWAKDRRGNILLIINKPYMAPIDNNTGIPIKKVLEMEDRREPHWSSCKGSNKIRMAGGQGREEIAMMLYTGPRLPQPRELVHFSRQKVRTGCKDLAIAAPVVMHAVDVYCACDGKTVSHKVWPLDARCMTGELDELGNGIGVREAQGCSFDLPALVLA